MLTFIEKGHIYRWDGRIVPSQSEITKAAGMQDFSHIPVDRLEASMQFGKAVHFTTEIHDRHTISQYEVDDEILPYLAGWIYFLDAFKPEIISIEGKEYSRAYDFACRHDRVLKIRGVVTLVDIKTYVDEKAAAGLQLGANKIAWDENHPKQKIRKRIIVHLMKREYKISIHNDPQDLNDFLVCNSIYKLKKKRRVL